VPLYELAHDRLEGEALQRRVLEGGGQVHRVVMAPALAADVQHLRAAQVSDQAPDRALGERHVVSDLTNRAVGVHGDVEEHGSVTGDEVPVVRYVLGVTVSVQNPPYLSGDSIPDA